MADPKYANLPGIAYDQPDLYETNDLPEADQGKNEIEEESEVVERIDISAPAAFSKFKDKSLNSENVDFSDKLSKHRRTGYDARSGNWELVGSGEKETPLQRYQRLQCEMKELLEDISSLKEEENSDVPTAVMCASVDSMLKQLEGLRLEKSLGTEIISNLNDPQGAQLKKLMALIDSVSLHRKEDSGDKGEPHGVEGEVKYQVNAKPSQAQLAQAARIADLEARINRLNSIVSASPTALKRIGGGERSLVETARWVSAKAALLEPSQLDAAETRLSVLISKLDQVAERISSISGNASAERDNKIAELYELAKSTEDISQVVPRALERMLALESLHHQGTEFAKSLSELESLQTVLTANCEANKEMVRRFEQNFNENLVTLKTNMEAFDARLKELQNKSKK